MKYLLIIFAVILFSSCQKDCQVSSPILYCTDITGSMIYSKNFITKANACRFLRNHPNGYGVEDF